MRFSVAVGAALFLVAGLGEEARATDMYWVMDYRTSAPLSNTSDFTGEFSWRGLGIEWHAMVARQVSAGVGFGFNSFWEETNELISVDNVDVSGEQFRYTNAIPIWGMFRYYPQPPEPGETRLFVGLDAGPYFVDRRLTIGFLAADDDNWHFGFAPEVGIQIPFSDYYTRGLFNVRYNYVLEAGDAPSQSWLDFEIGVAVDMP
jgi:hypothetical protein